MISVDALRELYDFNYWARDQQLAACATLTEEQFLRPLGSSFSSVRDTLAHLLGAEWIWRERWRGRSPQTMPGVPEGLAFEETLRRWHDQFPTVSAIRERWREVELGVRDYLAGLEEAALARSLVYVNIQGRTWSYPRWQCLVHLVNHGTYHRGQVATALRQLGVTPPGIDFLVYYNVRPGKAK